jgi:hypothetical protein
LRLIGVQLSDLALKRIATLSNLEAMWIYGSPGITNDNLQELAALSRLKYIDLIQEAIEPRTAINLQQALPDLNIKVRPEIQKAIDELRAKQSE